MRDRLDDYSDEECQTGVAVTRALQAPLLEMVHAYCDMRGVSLRDMKAQLEPVLAALEVRYPTDLASALAVMSLGVWSLLEVRADSLETRLRRREPGAPASDAPGE